MGGHVNVPFTSYMIYCHAAKISGIVYYVTCCYAAEVSSVGWGGVGWGGVGGHVNVPCTSYMIYCHAAKISGIVYDVTCCYAAKISGIADYVTCCYACVAAMTLKSQKTRPKFFQDFQSSNQHGTVVKSHFKKKNMRFMGTVSGPAGCLCYPISWQITDHTPSLSIC